MYQDDFEDYDEDSFDGDSNKRPLWWPIASAFEWCVAAVVDVIGSFAERSESLMGRIGAALPILFMPWRWLHRSPTNIELVEIDEANEFNPETNSAWQKVSDGFFFLLAPLYWCLDLVVVGYDFFGEWWYSRDFRKLLYALPAIGMLAVLCGSSVLGFLNSENKKIQRYATTLAAAEQADDAEHALLLKKKLEQLGFERLDGVEFSAAAALAKEGKFDQANAMMRTLAPLESAGMLRAHLWIAGGLLDGRISAETDPFREIETHVAHALSLDKDNLVAKRLSIELSIRKGKAGDVVEEMQELVARSPDLHVSLAHVFHQRAEMDKARHHARKAVAHYHRTKERRERERERAPSQTDLSSSLQSVDSDAQDDERELAGDVLLGPRGYLAIAESYHLIEEYDAELAMLQEAVLRYPHDPALRTVLTKSLATRLKGLRITDSTFGELVESICRQDPKNEDVVMMLVKGLLATEGEDTDSEEVVTATWRLVEHLEREGLLTSLVYQYAGDFHLLNNHDEEAVEFYIRTCRLDPKASFAWNNLAAIWSKTNSKMKHALKAADHAIELNADSRFYETRGQIRFKLKQFEKAIEDLETAISGSVPNAEDAHRTLVASYEAIGKKEQANAHRSLLSSFSRNE